LAALIRPIFCHEFFGCFFAELSLEFDLRSNPDSKFENELELNGSVIPSIVIAESVGRKIVIDGVTASPTVSKHMISLPSTIDPTTAYVASPSSFSQDSLAVLTA
jgi:hypothetical protein